MATSTKYFVLPTSANDLNFLDFDLRYGGITTVGETIQYTGESKGDSIFVRPGLTYDLSDTGTGPDKIYFGGNLADYSASTNGSLLTLTRTLASGPPETVTVTGGPNGFDTLVFANGSVSARAFYLAITSGSAPPTPDPVEISTNPQGAAAPGAALQATIKAFASSIATANTVGETFASTRPGINFIAVGGKGIDTVYVADGETVDATVTGTSVDLIYMRGKWADYTKTVSGDILVFTRQVGGVSESVSVAGGTLVNFDRLIFADGSVASNEAKTAITGNPAGGIATIPGYNPNQTTPLFSDPEIAAALATIRDAAQRNIASDTSPTPLVYQTAGVTGVTADNLASINSALNSIAVDGAHAETRQEVQAIVDAYKAILASADGNPTANTTTPITADQYATVGVTGVSGSGVGTTTHLLDDIVDISAKTAVDRVDEIQILANAARHVMDAAGGTPDQIAALTIGDLQALGVTGLTINNFPAILAAIASKADDAVDTRAELQSLVPVDHTPPTLQSSTPSDQGTLAASANLTLNFSEDVFLASSGTITIKALDGANDIVIDLARPNGQLSVSGHTLTINPSSDLAFSKQYAVQISAGALKDAADNNFAGIADTTTLNFTTLSATIGGGGLIGSGQAKSISGSSAYTMFSGTGDVNGDGYDDVLLGNFIDQYSNGNASVLYGNASGLSGTPSGSGGFGITGIDNSFGYFVTNVGDINGDGLDDLGIAGLLSQDFYTIGAPASIVYGRSDGSAIDMRQVAAGVGGFQVIAPVYSQIGQIVGMGDVNGDGYGDFAVYDLSHKAAHLTFGGPAGANGGYNLISDYQGTANVPGYAQAYGIAPPNALGDTNGDGLADMVAADSQGQAIFVAYGKTDSSAITFFQPRFDLTFAGYKITTTYGSLLRNAEGIGDVNGDGYADILITGTSGNGAPATAVVFGSASSGNVSLTNLGSRGFLINPETTGNPYVSTTYSGSLHVASMGDFNGDGLSDFALSTTVGDPNYATKATYFIVYGKADNAAVNLDDIRNSQTGGFAIDVASNGFAVQAVGLGDVNGDGLADVGLRTSNTGFMVVYGSATGAVGHTAVDQIGTTGDDLLTSTGSQTLVGGLGNDTLVAFGADVLLGGTGNDIFVVGAATIAALQSPMGTNGNTNQLATINGGGGIDTIRLSGGASFNLSSLEKPGLNVGNINSRVESIEKFDMATDSSANTLSLSVKDMFDMSDSLASNSTKASLGWTSGSYSFGTTESRHVMIIDGGSNDVVITSSGFVDTHQTAVLNGHTYEVYNQGSNAQLLIDPSINRMQVL